MTNHYVCLFCHPLDHLVKTIPWRLVFLVPQYLIEHGLGKTCCLLQICLCLLSGLNFASSETRCCCPEHCHLAASFADSEQHCGTKSFHAAILAFYIRSRPFHCAFRCAFSSMHTNPCPCRQFDHNPMKATRIGEASNPGPQFKRSNHDNAAIVAILNPTAIRNKHEEFQLLMDTHEVNTFCCAENSATKDTQSFMNKQFSGMGLTSVWSQPVPPQREKCNGQPSLRGRAGGTSIHSKWPIRDGLTTHLDPESAPDRICHAITQWGSCYVQILVIYGYTGGNKWHKNATNALFATAMKKLKQ